VQVKKLQPTWRIDTRTYWLLFFIELRDFKPNKKKRQAIPASLSAIHRTITDTFYMELKVKLKNVTREEKIK
jgi:hypothetical protein